MADREAAERELTDLLNRSVDTAICMIHTIHHIPLHPPPAHTWSEEISVSRPFFSDRLSHPFAPFIMHHSTRTRRNHSHEWRAHGATEHAVQCVMVSHRLPSFVRCIHSLTLLMHALPWNESLTRCFFELLTRCFFVR